MIISRTPLRISFVGGGSDIATYYKQQPGAVISTAIDKYIYIAVNNQFDGRIIVNYSKTEVVKKIDQIENNLVREALKLTGHTGGIHITSIADIPSEGTGMGSSSAYLVGLLNALYAYQGKHVDAQRLAEEACKIEIELLKKPIGKQDQYIAAYGGFQHIQFNKDGSVYVDPIICLAETKKMLEKELLLFYTGITRSADTILSKQTANMKSSKSKNTMTKMVGLTVKMKKMLQQNKVEMIGELLHKNWMFKKQMADGVTSAQINTLYALAMKNGAAGGKVLGAGGGGFLLICADSRKHEKIKKALPDLSPLDFRFEPQGSKIIFID